ncbi:hypothetical protein D3C73_1405670 [compost metagenome]
MGEPESSGDAGAVVKQSLSRAEGERVEEKVQSIEEIGLQQRADEVAAAEHVDVVELFLQFGQFRNL